MGTRCLICVVYRGKFVVAQFTNNDGYLSYQGANIVKFLMVPDNAERLRKGLANIYHTNEEETERLEKEGCPSVYYNAGAGILEMIASSSEENKVPIAMALEFANDSLFCEYVYVVDMDQDVFECYDGFVSGHKMAENRFKGVGRPDELVPQLLAEFSFDEIARMKSEEDFLEALKDDDEEEEEDDDDDK